MSKFCYNDKFSDTMGVVLKEILKRVKKPSGGWPGQGIWQGQWHTVG